MPEHPIETLARLANKARALEEEGDLLQASKVWRKFVRILEKRGDEEPTMWGTLRDRTQALQTFDYAVALSHYAVCPEDLDRRKALKEKTWPPSSTDCSN